MPWFHASIAASAESSWWSTHTGATATVARFGVGDDERDFDDAIGFRPEAGHLHVDPDQAVGVLRHAQGVQHA